MICLPINNLKQTLKGCAVRILKRHTGTFQKQRKWLDSTQWLNDEQLKILQFRLLKQVVTHAYESVPYYRNKMMEIGFRPDDIQNLEDITKLPILSKNDIKSADGRLLSRRFNKIFLRTAHTGGTTGERLTLKRDLRSIANEHAFVRRQFDWAGVGLYDRCGYLMARTVAPPSKKVDKPYVYDAATKLLTLSTYHLSEAMVPTYAKAITNYKIKALVTYPSAAYVMAKGCLNKKIELPIKVVLTTSETLDSAKKQMISEAFKCKVYDFYGSAERVCYIYTCEHGSYHIIPEYGLTELIPAQPPNEDCYRIIATGFWNMAMPLIRYDTGDLVQPSERKCECGRAFPVIKKIIGRESSILTTPSGLVFGASTVEAIMETILFKMQDMPVLEGQVIQKSCDHMTLEYVPLNNFSNKDEDKLKSLVRECFPHDFTVSIRSVEKITRTTTGKSLSLVISHNHR